jgi:hypothetical protein
MIINIASATVAILFDPEEVVDTVKQNYKKQNGA